MIDQHNSLAEKFIKKWFWLYIFSFIIAPMWYVVKIILSYDLTVSDIGLLYWIISLIILVSSYNDLWMTESIHHFVPDFVTNKRYDKIKTILTYALIAQMSTGITIALFFFFWAPWLEMHYFKSDYATEVLRIFCLFFLWVNIFQIIQTFFMSIQNTFYNKLTELFRMGFILLCVLFLFFWDFWSLINYSYAWIVWLYMWIIIAVWIFYKKYFLPHLKNEKIIWEKEFFFKLLKYSLLGFLWSQAATILGQIDMQMIIYMLGTEDAGYYTNYLSIIGIPFMIIWPIFWLLFPIFSEMHSKWEHEKIKLVKQIFTSNFLLIWMASNIFLFVFALPMTYVLFGEKFLTSWVILQYSVLLLVFNFLLQINFNILAGIGKVLERVKIICVAIVVNVIMNWLLINAIGVAGASLATWFWWFVIRILSEFTLWKTYSVKIAWTPLIKNTCILGWLGWLVLYFFTNFSYFIQNYSRIEWFFILLWTGIIYFWIFVLINYTIIKNFISEIKKIKWK